MKNTKSLSIALALSIALVMTASCSHPSQDTPGAKPEAPVAKANFNVEKAVEEYVQAIDDPHIRATMGDDCGDWEKNLEDYHKGIYRYGLGFFSTIEGDINGDNINDRLISYGGDNCWNGIGRENHLSNFFILTSKDGQHIVDHDLNMQLKKSFMEALNRYCPEVKVETGKAHFQHGVDFKEIKDGSIKGTFFVFDCDENDYVKGDFTFYAKAGSISFEEVMVPKKEVERKTNDKKNAVPVRFELLDPANR